ncbi:MAG: hypothetical protein AAGI01_18255 [Myxococcota bacterium]
MNRLFLSVSACTLLLLVSACEHPPSNVTPDIADLGEEGAPSVNLPTVPGDEAFTIKERNDDGTFRIIGLIENQDSYLRKQVEVRALVSQISEECDVSKASKEGKTCPEPYIVLKDEEDSDEQMLVVGFEHPVLKKAKVKVGETTSLKGTYVMDAQGFSATETGLLVLDEIGGVSVAEK